MIMISVSERVCVWASVDSSHTGQQQIKPNSVTVNHSSGMMLVFVIFHQNVINTLYTITSVHRRKSCRVFISLNIIFSHQIQIRPHLHISDVGSVKGQFTKNNIFVLIYASLSCFKPAGVSDNTLLQAFMHNAL